MILILMINVIYDVCALHIWSDFFLSLCDCALVCTKKYEDFYEKCLALHLKKNSLFECFINKWYKTHRHKTQLLFISLFAFHLSATLSCTLLLLSPLFPFHSHVSWCESILLHLFQYLSLFKFI